MTGYHTASNVAIFRDVTDIWFGFWLAGYPVVFHYPVPVLDPAEMLNSNGYHNRKFYGQCNSITA